MATMDLHDVDANSTVRIEPERRLTPEEFYQFCLVNDGWQIEQSADGEIEIMPPAGLDTSGDNNYIGMKLGAWADADGRGYAYDSSGGFRLANGATRSPDAAWIRCDALETLSPEQRAGFPSICPDFVIELASPSDSIPRLKRKMREWIENGAHLGWLIDPRSRTVYVYRRKGEVEVVERPDQIRGEEPVDGFVLEMQRVWTHRR